MTSNESLSVLHEIANAYYERQRSDFDLILAQEARLREDLARLDASVPQCDDEESGYARMQMIGADVLWQGWLGRAKTRINMELAQTLARKAQATKRVKDAFGKILALDEMIVTIEKENRKAKERSDLELALQMALTKTPSRGVS